MKISLHTIWMIISLISSALYNSDSFAQCGVGLSQVAINWDYQYYKNSALPGSGINYMMGKNTMRMTWNSATFNGVLGEHTNHTGSFGVGNDIKFTLRNGSVTFTFLEPVENLRFTVYDIDNGQEMRPNAFDVSNNKLPITVARAAGGGAGTLLNVWPFTDPYYTLSNAQGLTSNTGAINISVDGPVKTMVINFTRPLSTTADPIYISDISACTNSTWATDYQSISAPETGQPTHMLVSYDSIVYVVNKLDNTAMELFSDPTMNRINTMAYDPYKQVIYYCNSARYASNRSVYKYDVKTGVKSTFINDVNTLGMQTFTYGLATGGATVSMTAIYS